MFRKSPAKKSKRKNKQQSNIHISSQRVYKMIQEAEESDIHCVGTTKTGKKCKKYRAKGNIYCTMHSKNGQQDIKCMEIEPTMIDIGESSSKEPLTSAVRIDNFVFVLLGKFDFGGRTLIRIQSNNQETGETHYFNAYASLSEGGLYRYCIYDITDKRFVKGTDYVTETFIHMDLQKLITTDFNDIPIIDPVDCDYDREEDDKKYCVNDQIIGKPAFTSELLSSYGTRLLNVPSLDILRLCPNGLCMDPIAIQHFLFPGEGSLSSQRKIAAKCGLKTLKKDLLSNPYYQELLAIVNEVRKVHTPQKYHPDIEDTYYFFAECVSAYLSNHIRINGSPEYLFSNLAMIDEYQPEYDEKSFAYLYNNYYQVSILIDGNPFIMIFNKYYIEMGPDSYLENSYVGPHNKQEYCIITNIIPEGDPVTKFGTYQYIISAGFLIYKPLEYKTFTPMRNEATKSYTFIGNILSEIYPVSEVCKSVTAHVRP